MKSPQASVPDIPRHGTTLPRPLNVLIVEDNPTDAEMELLALQSAGFEPAWERVETEAAYLERLNGKLDLVLSDFSLPQFNGLRALELLQQSGLDIPFILISGTIGEDIAVQALRKGATDYLLKDRLVRLGPAVTNALAEGRLRRERRRADETLRIAQGQLSQLLEHSPAVLYLLKLEGDKVIPHLVSENVAALLGFTVAESLNYDWWFGQLHPDDRERAVSSVSEVIRVGANVTEYRLRHKDGRYCWVNDARRLIRDAAGAPAEIIGVWMDITERKRAEDIVQQVSGNVTRGRRIQVRIELAMLVASAVAFYALAARFNWFEFSTHWIRSNEAEQLDEIFFTVIFLVAGLAVFAFRRWRETESERTSQHQAQVALGLLHDELDRRVRQRTAELAAMNRTLSEAELKYRSIYENSSEGIFQNTAGGRLISANPALARMLGFASSEEMLRQRTNLEEQGYSDPAQRDNFKRRLEERGFINGYEYEIRRKDGSRIWVSENVRIVRATAGQAEYYEGSMQDITERKQAEGALGESEKRFKALFEQAAVGVALTDAATGRLVQVNQRFADIVGRGREELAQLTYIAITHPADVGHDSGAMQQLRLGGIREFTREKRYLRKDGAEVWANLTVSAMWVPGETPTYCIAVVQDITQRKQLETQLRQAQQMEAIGTLAGGIAHDFNNILAAIAGYTDLARLKLTGHPGVREHLDSVMQAVKRAADLVRQILTFSREQPLKRRLIKLPPVVTECVKLLRVTMPASIELDMILAPDAPTVLADETQVHQILMNLGTNASHALKDRPGRIEVKLEKCVVDEAQMAVQRQLRAGLYARVSVSDTGSGMDPETLRRIFEPFFTTKTPGAGTGLGLAVVHGIMDSHEGVITVCSQPGEGTIFCLYFPAHAVETALTKEPAGSPGRGEWVLYVDDEELLVELGGKALRTLGYEVVTVRQPAAALALVRADPQRFALVITDQAMPGMTGLQLAGELRQIRPDLPIMLTTGYSLTLTAERVKAAGIHQLLLKPITVQSLGVAVQAALAGEPPTQHVSNPPY